MSYACHANKFELNRLACHLDYILNLMSPILDCLDAWIVNQKCISHIRNYGMMPPVMWSLLKVHDSTCIMHSVIITLQLVFTHLVLCTKPEFSYSNYMGPAGVLRQGQLSIYKKHKGFYNHEFERYAVMLAQLYSY